MSEEKMIERMHKEDKEVFERIDLDYTLGLMYEKGQDECEQDYLKAAEYYRNAAAKGNSVAQNQLGLLYANGHLEPDDAKAVEFFRLAAEQGNAAAQNNLGFMLENGRGVAKSRQKAEYWYKQSADQDFELAKNNLARLNDPKLRPLICPFCHFESERGVRACRGCQASILYPTDKNEKMALVIIPIAIWILSAVVWGFVGLGVGLSSRNEDLGWGIFWICPILSAFAVFSYYKRKLSKAIENGDVIFRR